MHVSIIIEEIRFRLARILGSLKAAGFAGVDNPELGRRPHGVHEGWELEVREIGGHWWSPSFIKFLDL